MKVETQITRGAALVRIRGRKMVMGDADTRLREVLGELSEAGVRKVLLDLRRVREVDGACLQEILAWGRKLSGLGGELILVRPGLSDVGSLVTLLHELRSFPDRTAALEAAPPPDRLRVVAAGPLRVLDRLLAGGEPLRASA